MIILIVGIFCLGLVLSSGGHKYFGTRFIYTLHQVHDIVV